MTVRFNIKCAVVNTPLHHFYLRDKILQPLILHKVYSCHTPIHRLFWRQNTTIFEIKTSMSGYLSQSYFSGAMPWGENQKIGHPFPTITLFVSYRALGQTLHNSWNVQTFSSTPAFSVYVRSLNFHELSVPFLSSWKLLPALSRSCQFLLPTFPELFLLLFVPAAFLDDHLMLSNGLS